MVDVDNGKIASSIAGLTIFKNMRSTKPAVTTIQAKGILYYKKRAYQKRLT